ncbi:hypothetical protein Bca4012_064872 [Brassica carinata]
MDPWVEKQEKREMKKMKKHFDMVQFIADAEYRIPNSCTCRGRIVDEVSTNPKDKDFLPGRSYFTCNAFKCNYVKRVTGVEEEARRLRMEVDEMAVEIAAL